MKDYRVNIIVKNNLLYQAMIENEINTAAELSRITGIHQVAIGRCLNLKTSLYNFHGKIRPVWICLSKALRRLPEDLCPKDHWFESLENNKTHIEANKEDLIAIPKYLERESNPLLEIENKEKKQKIKEAINSLTSRQKKVLMLRFGLEDGREWDLEEVSKKIGVSRQRIIQIQKKALEILRHPKWKSILSDFA